MSPENVARSLAWQDAMVDLEGATLGELAVEFAQQTGRTIKIDDPSLRGVRSGGRVPMSDPEIFIRALERIYDVKAEHRANGAIELSRAAQRSCDKLPDKGCCEVKAREIARVAKVPLNPFSRFYSDSCRHFSTEKRGGGSERGAFARC